jgi:multicomponent Na+:H+ antiporter subunit D
MIAPAATLVILAIAVGVLPHLGAAVEAGVIRFQDQAAYNAAVLSGVHVAHAVALHPSGPTSVTLSSILLAIGSVTGSVLLALAGLYWRRLPLLRRGFEPGVGLVRLIDGFQSGTVNDCVTWVVVGLACVGGALAFTIHWHSAGDASSRELS